VFFLRGYFNWVTLIEETGFLTTRGLCLGELERDEGGYEKKGR